MLKRIVFNTSLFMLVACNNNESTTAAPAENDVDAARTFIRSALDGRWKDAKRLIVQDSVNVGDLDATEQNYTQHMNVTDQRGYRESTIRIYDTRKLNDSVSIVTYSNTYKNQKDSLKVVRQNGSWLVDLKYSFPNSNAAKQ
jgi:hypothetical protein